jgi:hypothetical protein
MIGYSVPHQDGRTAVAQCLLSRMLLTLAEAPLKDAVRYPVTHPSHQSTRSKIPNRTETILTVFSGRSQGGPIGQLVMILHELFQFGRFQRFFEIGPGRLVRPVGDVLLDPDVHLRLVSYTVVISFL